MIGFGASHALKLCAGRAPNGHAPLFRLGEQLPQAVVLRALSDSYLFEWAAARAQGFKYGGYAVDICQLRAGDGRVISGAPFTLVLNASAARILFRPASFIKRSVAAAPVAALMSLAFHSALRLPLCLSLSHLLKRE
jgi:hypothetical protein